MMKYIFYAIVIFVAVYETPVNSVIIPEGCDNKLNERNFVVAHDENNNTLYNFTDCLDLTNNLPEICEIYGEMGKQCCEACYTIDTTCMDTRLKKWIVDNKLYNCSEYVALGDCLCVDPVVSDSCCTSCHNIDTSQCPQPTTPPPPCADKLSAGNPITMSFGTTTIQLTSCLDMVKSYRMLCLQFSGEGNECCKSCEGVDLTCVDKLVTIEGEMCPDYVKADPCRCKKTVTGQKVSEFCCQSCSEAKVPDSCCIDRLSDVFKLPLSHPVTKETIAVLTSCDQITSYPSLCSNEAVNGEFGYCCKTCKKILGGKMCVDYPNVTITQGDKKYSCAEFVAQDDPCNCLKIENAKKDCCASCKGKDTSGCGCRDLVSPTNKISFANSDKEFDSCEDLNPDYLDLCKHLGGKENACCLTCRGVDTKCLDSSLAEFTTPDGIKRNCDSYIASDVCNCKLTNQCCSSCKGVNTSHCKCYDSVSPIYPLTLETAEGEVIGTVDSCLELINEHPSQCANPAISKKEGKCCEACKAIPHPNCLDERSATFTINDQSYSCAELIGSISNCFCNDVIDGISVGVVCCASCKKQDTTECRCRDMVRNEIPVDITDKSGNVIAQVTSCQELVAKYPDQCEHANGRGGVCCQSCKSVPNPTCLNLLTTPVVLSNSIQIRTCDELADNFPELCRQLGGEGNLCCKACRSISTKCLDTRLRQWTRGDSVYACAGWVGLDKCNCKDSSVATECCQSCKVHFKRGLDKVNCDCRDTLHPDHKATVTLALGNITLPVTSCKQVGQNYKWLCREPNFKALCCKTCSLIDITCLNDNVVFNDGTTTCAKFIDDDKCNCVKTVSGRQVGEVCCGSCKRRDLSNCGCRNTITEDNPITFSDGNEITNCRILKMRKYNKLCEIYGQPGGECCQACSEIDTDCTDDPLVNFFYKHDPDTTYKCQEWIKSDPCHCYKPETKQRCCVSCLMIKTDNCKCRDAVSPAHPIIAEITDIATGFKENININSCAELKAKYPERCPEFGGEENLCCITCPDPCQDNQDWRGTVGRRTSKCTDCTCAEVAGKQRFILKRACCENDNGFKDNCCSSCKKIKC